MWEEFPMVFRNPLMALRICVILATASLAVSLFPALQGWSGREFLLGLSLGVLLATVVQLFAPGISIGCAKNSGEKPISLLQP